MWDRLETNQQVAEFRQNPEIANPGSVTLGKMKILEENIFIDKLTPWAGKENAERVLEKIKFFATKLEQAKADNRN
jgi:hypothetical protein